MFFEYAFWVAVFSAGVAMIVTGIVGLKRRPKEVPVPWDGEHRLRGIKHIEHYGNMPDDFSTGWLWECTCGINNKHNYWRLPYTEGDAVNEYKTHKQTYVEMDKSFGG